MEKIRLPRKLKKKRKKDFKKIIDGIMPFVINALDRANYLKTISSKSLNPQDKD